MLEGYFRGCSRLTRADLERFLEETYRNLTGNNEENDTGTKTGKIPNILLNSIQCLCNDHGVCTWRVGCICTLPGEAIKKGEDDKAG